MGASRPKSASHPARRDLLAAIPEAHLANVEPPRPPWTPGRGMVEVAQAKLDLERNPEAPAVADGPDPGPDAVLAAIRHSEAAERLLHAKARLRSWIDRHPDEDIDE